MSQGIGLIKRGFHEVPHLMFGAIGFVTSGAILTLLIRRHRKYERPLRQWKRRYTVVREEEFDPKKQIHPIERHYPFW